MGKSDHLRLARLYLALHFDIILSGMRRTLGDLFGVRTDTQRTILPSADSIHPFRGHRYYERLYMGIPRGIDRVTVAQKLYARKHQRCR